MTTLRTVRLPVLGLLVAGALVGTGCGSSSGSSSSPPPAGGMSGMSRGGAASGGKGVHTTHVTIKNFKYHPAKIVVPKGATVTFSNKDSAEHTATANKSGMFDTGTVRPGQTKSAMIHGTGTIAYHCDFHPFMHGTIVVK